MNTKDSPTPRTLSDKEAWAALTNRPGERVTWRFVACVIVVAAMLATGIYLFYTRGGLQI